jgi:hypothetical protein
MIDTLDINLLSCFVVLNKNGEPREFYRRIWKVSESFKTTGMKMGMWGVRLIHHYSNGKGLV